MNIDNKNIQLLLGGLEIRRAFVDRFDYMMMRLWALAVALLCWVKVMISDLQK